MPFLEDGRPVDVVLNPLGVPSRMNIARSSRLTSAGPRARGVRGVRRPHRRQPACTDRAPNPHPVATPVFDGATETDVDEALVRWAETTDSPIKMNVDQSAPPAARPRARCSSQRQDRQPFEQRSRSATCTS